MTYARKRHRLGMTAMVRPARPSAAKRAALATPAIEPFAGPVVHEPVPVPAAALKPLEELAAIPDARPVEKSALGDALPVAGGAGVVMLALAGAGIAVRRRRRRREEEQFDLWQTETESAQDVSAEPEPLWDPPAAERKPADLPPVTPATEAPDGFDTSNLGDHVPAAYRGPTPEKPAMPLRNRLEMAGELDRRESEGGTPGPPAPSPTKPFTAPPSKQIQSISFSFSGTPTHLKWPQSRA